MAFIEKVLKAVRGRVKVPVVYLPESLEDAERMANLADEHVMRVVGEGGVAIVVFVFSASLPLKKVSGFVDMHTSRMSEAGMLTISSDSFGCNESQLEFQKKVFGVEFESPEGPQFVLLFECKWEWAMPKGGEVK